MKELLENFKSFDSFLKDQLIIGFLIQCNWSLVSPIIFKLQGILWTTSFISAYMIMMRLGGIVAPYFKGTSLKKAYRTIVFLNIIYLLAVPFFFYSQLLFLWIETFLSIFFCINSLVIGIAWDLYTVNTYSKETFENYRYACTFRDGLGGIGGNLIVIAIYSVLNENQSMILFGILMIAAICLQIYNYRKHYVKME